MPRSSTGKWVARAASTGGGRTYRGQVPINWYAVLVLIVLLGVASVVVSRIDYRSGPVVNTTPPLKGATPWYAAISFDICGTQRAPLPANLLNATTQSFYTTGNGIITISPKQTSDAGHNAVLGKFVSSYPGLTLTATQLHLPAPTTTTAPGSTTSTTAPGSTTSTSSTSTTTSTTTSTSSPSGKKVKSASGRTYRSGEKCPSGTKDAGKTADVMVTYWKNAFAAKGKPVTVQGNPGTLLFSDDQLITVGFVPAGTRLPKPNSTIVTALFDIASGRSTTTTTAPGSTTTTAPGSTTTTTAPGSTTTTAPGSTTTSTTTKAG